ncbi:MAG: transaldolase [Nitrospiraceae bacterium]|nr:MAG: transaldolase [Nitrospiraceae bacterium]
MNENPLRLLNHLGQSVWLDYLGREIIDSGKLKKLIDEDSLSGVTSNPTIFQKAISGSTDYDRKLKALIDKDISDAKELFLGLAIDDISDAADILWPVYESTGGKDGFVSIEVSPDLAFDTGETIEEARHLFSTIGKKNILVKVPATEPGLPAIEQLTSEGININVTLLFSVNRYAKVAEAYIKGLEKRVSEGKPIHEIRSVASFFVSRVDTLTDKLIEDKINVSSSADEKETLRGLCGKAAVANAKYAYKKYEEIFLGDRFSSVKEKGANIQRLLWGSTGTKNPDYSDVKYIEDIIAPNTVNTLPEKTINAFRDHGKAVVTIYNMMNGAEATLAELKSHGIDIEEVADQLEKEGVKSFSDSFFALLKEIEEKRKSFFVR